MGAHSTTALIAVGLGFGRIAEFVCCVPRLFVDLRGFSGALSASARSFPKPSVGGQRVFIRRGLSPGFSPAVRVVIGSVFLATQTQSSRAYDNSDECRLLVCGRRSHWNS